jgi:hypothetical protein
VTQPWPLVNPTGRAARVVAGRAKTNQQRFLSQTEVSGHFALSWRKSDTCAGFENVSTWAQFLVLAPGQHLSTVDSFYKPHQSGNVLFFQAVSVPVSRETWFPGYSVEGQNSAF